VTRETDFIALYDDLGVAPGCALGEFRQAYRRRMALLHPDRQPGGVPDERSAEHLRRLTALYGAAMAFERQHGRLPGAAQLRTQLGNKPAGASCVPAASNSVMGPRRARRVPLWLGVAVAAGLAWTLWPATTPPDSAADDGAAAALTPQAERGYVARPARIFLQRGMPSTQVRALEGEPTLVSGSRWEYGPSWVRLDNDKVVDWYSSALRPLKARRMRPTLPQP
jgi:hypothetical protein